MSKLRIVIGTAAIIAATVPCVYGQEKYPPDNSGRNAEDRGTAKTAQDQSNAPSDLKITQEIRKAVVADKRLSTNAHNVKIITEAGVVTLRGAVKDGKEKQLIDAKARKVHGVTRVDNQIEVASASSSSGARH